MKTVQTETRMRGDVDQEKQRDYEVEQDKSHVCQIFGSYFAFPTTTKKSLFLLL